MVALLARFGRELAFLFCIFFCSAVHAQRVKVEAVPGIPFGVGRIVIPLESYIESETLDTHFMSISDAEGRIHYPALRYTQPLGMIRELLNMPEEGAPSQLHVHFLFRGNAPLQVQLNTPKPQSMTIVPNGRPVAYRRLLRSWWVRYKAAARKQRREGDYSPIIETYLTSMLSRRMGLANALPDDYDTGESLSILLGLEKVRMAMMQQSVYGNIDRNEPLDLPFPQEIEWPEHSTPELKDIYNPGELVEEIANHVPHECFYIRFGQFPNYMWLRRLLEEYGGDLSRMVMLRGTDSQLNDRVESQLGLRESSLSRVLGPQVISDIAMIGRDTFLQEGAAIGILFEAKSNLLKGELQNQRKQRVKELKEVGATMETVTIGDTEVSFASTPDNRLRSFQVHQGKYHLVTNCLEIARRFIECSEGEDSLGASDEFRYARTLISHNDEDDTLFVYLSRRFFEGLLSPQYQIELHRRLRSVTDIELMELATLAAVSEGFGNEPITMERLVQLGFLGSRVDMRSDSSFTKVVNRRAHDSLRGSRGTFLPIPDTPVGKVTRSEANRFRRTADFHRKNWTEMDPVLIGLRRSTLDDHTERVEIQARMLPLNQEKYGAITNFFAPPTNVRVRSLPDDIISVQGFIDGGNLGIGAHHLYFGIRDAAPKQAYSERRFLKSLQVLRTAPAYLAAWPKPGLLDSFGLGGRDMGDGYRKMLLGLYRLDALNGFSLLSFDPQILSEVAPQLTTEEVAEPAQLHVKIGDVKNSNFGKWANDLDFQRAWETSVGNVRLLHVLTQQMHVPMGQTKEVAERVLNARLICPLGGEYQLVDNQDGTQRWASTAWIEGKTAKRDEYVSPLMNWLRGFIAAVTIEEDRVVATGELDIQREKQVDKGEGIKLPNVFDFFGGGSKKTGDAKNKNEAKQTADAKQGGGEAVKQAAEEPTPSEGAPEELPPPVPVPN